MSFDDANSQIKSKYSRNDGGGSEGFQSFRDLSNDQMPLFRTSAEKLTVRDDSGSGSDKRNFALAI
jgi:hypothetical protein